MQIWKQVLEPETTFNPPIGTEFLHVAEQNGQVCLWFLCDPAQPTESRKVVCVGTGHETPANGEYLGSALLMHSTLVIHAFEV